MIDVSKIRRPGPPGPRCPSFKFPDLKDWQALLLVSLANGVVQNTDEILTALAADGWKIKPDDLHHYMKGLEKRCFIERPRGQNEISLERRSVGNPAWHKITSTGKAALKEFCDFRNLIKKKIASANRASARRAVSGNGRPENIVLKPRQAGKPRCMNGIEWPKFLASSAPEEFKLLAAATQRASLGDAVLLCDEAASIDYQDEDWANLGEHLRLKRGPFKGRTIQITEKLRAALLAAPAMRTDALVFPTPTGALWCDPSQGSLLNQNVQPAFRPAVRRAGLNPNRIRCPWIKGKGQPPTPAEEKKILKQARPEFRLFYLTATRTNIDRRILAALRWSDVVLQTDKVRLKIKGQMIAVEHEEVIKALREARDLRDAGPLFLTPKRGRWSREKAQTYYWRPVKVECGFDPEVQLYENAERKRGRSFKANGRVGTQDASAAATEQRETFGDWEFAPGSASYRRVTFTVKGKPWRLLRALAASKLPMIARELASAISDDQESLPAASTVRVHLNALRRLLREHFSIPGDPFPCVDRGKNAAWKFDASVVRKRLR